MAAINNFIAAIVKSIYKFTGSYGWSILIFTFLVKLVLYPLTAKQTKFMEKMKVVQPQMKELQEKYKDNKEELNKRVLTLYQKEKINPLTGCLPFIIQLPILWSVFMIFREPEKFLQIKDAMFYGLNLMKIDYQGVKLILPVLSGITTYWQQKMMTVSTTDPAQKFMMSFLPIFIGFITMSFPTGLALYWIFTNVLTIGQQYLMKVQKTI